MSKACFKCLGIKPLTDFYRHKGMADGRLGKCKACAKADVMAHRSANLERIREYDRARGLTDARRERVRAYASTPDGKSAQRRGAKAWAERNRDKRLAQMAAGNAVTRRRMARGPCEVCGTTEGVQGHHDDYSRPLDVRWLCVAHHAEHHRVEREKARQKTAPGR